MKNSKTTPPAKSGWLAVGLMAVVLAVLFWRSFLPDYVFFSNDGPLGVQNSAWLRMPSGMTGMWTDLNYLGASGGAYTPSITAMLHLLSPISFAKFYPPIALFILGLGIWTLCRQFKLSPLAAILGALAAMLNSTYFSTACWGVASQQIAVGMDSFALALVVGCSNKSALVRWTRLALAGLCVGMNVMEAADIGALYSVLIALFVFVHALFESEDAPLRKAFRGASRVIVVAAFAGFIAYQAVFSLIGISIQGVAGTAQDSESKAAHWDWATSWSLPKTETLGLIVPGLFGYKMDTPNNMQPSLRDAYENGVYWGGMGRSSDLDHFIDSGSQGEQPAGLMRFCGGGNYCGILVLLVAGWAIVQSLRRKDSAFSDFQKHMIQFWAMVLLFSLLLAWGRFAPFYAIIYHLPYFSTIRIPAKFLNFFDWSLVIIFAFGVHALNRGYLDTAARKPVDINAQKKNWWSNVSDFDRKWTFASAGMVVASVLGCLIYMAQKPELISYLQRVGFADIDPTHEASAPAIAAFSFGQVGWFLVLFIIAVGLLLLVITGCLNGPRAKIGMVLLGGFLIFDMGRANLPWLVDWNYKQKYEVGTLNPIVELLREKPYEHRVAYVAQYPMQTPPQWGLFEQLYKIEWMQHHFPFYNIQSLDLVQNPRPPADMLRFETAFQIRGRRTTAGGMELDPDSVPLIARRWQVTNTRYLLGPAAFLDLLNQQLDPVQHRFSVVQRFEVVPKPGITQATSLEEITAVPNPNGAYALFDFTGALPRAKVYSNWQVNTNDDANLNTLGDLNFDPAKTVLISTPENGLPMAATNENSGSVEYQSYATKHVVLSAKTAGPSVLLLNDKYDPQWSVTVDGKPAELLRCNFIMRGVYLPAAGQHTVDFKFQLPHRPLYVTLTAIALGIGMCGFLAFASRNRQREPV